MELLNNRPVTDFVVGTYSETEIQDKHFMYLEEQKAHEELKFRGFEYAYTKADSLWNGEYVRVFRVWKNKEK